MIATLHQAGHSFRGAVEYCLRDARLPGEGQPDTSERVEWSDTRNVAADDPRQAARVMAATAERSEELKQLAGVKAGGRKLEKPVCHYSLNWGKDEQPSRKAMERAAAASLNVLGLEDRQAVVVAHRDRQPHVHVVVNRVSVEDGRAAKLGNSFLKLSRWAEGYERRQGQIRCPQRVENNARRQRGEWVKQQSLKPGRYRRGEGRESQLERQEMAAARNAWDVAVVVVKRVDEQKKWERAQEWRRENYRDLEWGQRRQWGELYRQQEGERQDLSQDWGSLRGRVRQWRAQGRSWGELAGVIRGKSRVLSGWEQQTEQRHLEERAELVREHGRESRGVEQGAEQVYREALQEPIQIGDEDKPALAAEVFRQERGLPPEQQGLGVGIGRVQELNIERERDGPDL